MSDHREGPLLATTGAQQHLSGPSRAMALAMVDDLQGQSADLGWSEASSLLDALVGEISHLLVDLADGAPSPTPRPAVVGAIGGRPGSLDHASCRACAASLRRAGALLLDAGPGWPAGAGHVALDLADLLDHTTDLDRSGRLALSHKGNVLRRLRAAQRSLRSLGH